MLTDAGWISHGYVNFYLVEGEGGVTIVDSGLPPMWTMLPKSLALLGYDRRGSPSDQGCPGAEPLRLPGHGEPWTRGVEEAVDIARGNGAA
ncbi:hypothetical protein [Arthrobacter sp. A5]|uniref:hypothetical protein n=1 Tax=Arthrobacter sp. A5 TaxID=576926 RepID=UPI003DAA2F29